MITYPNCKINIGLNIVAKRPDGYHNIESVFYPICLQDALEIHSLPNDEAEEEYMGCKLKVSGIPLDGSPRDNLVFRAYRLLKEEFSDKVKPVRVHLFKHIPCGAGLGGGSSDCAFMLKALNERFDLQLSTAELEARAIKLGADCAFFVQNRPMFVEGIGDKMTPQGISLKGMTLVLVKPNVFVSTHDAYAHIVPKRPHVSLRTLLGQPIETWKENVVNDFEASVFSEHPEIAAIKDKLYDLGAVYASMSGSGSAVYGIFRNKTENIDEEFSGCFCRQRTLDW